MNKLELAKNIFDAIYEAITDGYYKKEDMQLINFAEIRDWCGLKCIEPGDDQYTKEEKDIDTCIEKICESLEALL